MLFLFNGSEPETTFGTTVLADADVADLGERSGEGESSDIAAAAAVGMEPAPPFMLPTRSFPTDTLMPLSDAEAAAVEAKVKAQVAADEAARGDFSGLFLDDNPLGKQGVMRLVRWLSSARAGNLTTLSLVHCDLGPDAARALLPAAVGLPALQHLNLACNPRLPMALVAAACVTGFPALRSLNVTYCEASERDLVRLVAAATQSHHHLRELDLSQTLLPPLWSWNGLAQLSEALAKWGWLLHGSSDDPAFAGEGGDEVAVGEEPGRKAFQLVGRRVRIVTPRWIDVDELRGSDEVHLGNGRWSDMEVFAMARSLGRNRRMRSLDLSFNGFGAVGAMAVLKAVYMLPGLDLDLTGNNMTLDVVGAWVWNDCRLKVHYKKRAVGGFRCARRGCCPTRADHFSSVCALVGSDDFSFLF
jgi:hypothetical protein